MEYNALLVSIDYLLYQHLKKELENAAIKVTYTLTIADGIRQFAQRRYDLVVVAFTIVRDEIDKELLLALRRSKFTPIFALTNGGDATDVARMIDYGVDVCLPAATPPLIIAKHAFSLVRRYTGYNNFDNPDTIDVVPFCCGDFFIDPLRRTVQVKNAPIELRPREFSLLLYLMRNPSIVLTAEQICDNAWGMEGSYGQGVSSPIAILRRQIEPDLAHPVYIETIRRIGYRFTAHKSETCER